MDLATGIGYRFVEVGCAAVAGIRSRFVGVGVHGLPMGGEGERLRTSFRGTLKCLMVRRVSPKSSRLTKSLLLLENSSRSSSISSRPGIRLKGAD